MIERVKKRFNKGVGWGEGYAREERCGVGKRRGKKLNTIANKNDKGNKMPQLKQVNLMYVRLSFNICVQIKNERKSLTIVLSFLFIVK